MKKKNKISVTLKTAAVLFWAAGVINAVVYRFGHTFTALFKEQLLPFCIFAFAGFVLLGIGEIIKLLEEKS
jgi:hypothetical protein